MTASTIAPTYLMLYDLCPGPIGYDLPPADSSGDVFGNASHCNVASAAYPQGTKVAYYDTTNSGWSIMAYLKFVAGTGTAGDGLLAGGPYDDGTNVHPYSVTHDGETTNQTYGYAAVAVVEMTTTYYGWFWVGGVCPSDKAPNLAAVTTGIITPSADVAKGEMLVLADSSNSLCLDNVGTLTLPIVALALFSDA